MPCPHLASHPSSREMVWSPVRKNRPLHNGQNFTEVKYGATSNRKPAVPLRYWYILTRYLKIAWTDQSVTAPWQFRLIWVKAGWVLASFTNMTGEQKHFKDKCFNLVSCWQQNAVANIDSRAYKANITFNANALFKPLQPKVFGVKFRLWEIASIFSTKIRNFKLWKMTKLINFRFPEGWYFFKSWQYWTEKILSDEFFCFRTASLGGSGWKGPTGRGRWSGRT